MRAITMTEPGGPDVLRWTETPEPTPGPGEVLIDVAASAVNRADLLQRQGFYPPPPGASDILGLECSGTIAGLGDGVTDWRIGDEVCALLAGGGYAEKVVVPAPQVLPLPPSVELAAAAALPEVVCTVWSNVVMTAGLRAGEVLLVHGGAGGIGSCAIQIGKALGATVVATAGGASRVQACRDLGADLAIDYRERDFVAEITAVHDGADVILDNMGAVYLDRNLRSLRTGGRLVVIGFQGGRKAELDLGRLLAKRAMITSIGLRSRPVDGPAGKGAIIEAVRREVWPMIADGRLRPIVHTRIPLPEAATAHRLLDAGGVLGKILLVNDERR